MINFSQPAKIFVSLVFLFIIVVSVFSFFVDFGYLEPDGISILAGSINLKLAKAGKFFLYKYYIQPLTYETTYLISKIVPNLYYLYYLPLLIGSIGICFLTLGIYFSSGRKINIYVSFFLLLFFPEIFYRLLYFNSSVFGMTMYSVILCLLFRDGVRYSCSNNYIKYFLAGCLLAFAVLFRIDFIIGAPLIMYLIIFKGRINNLWFFIIGFSLILGIFYLLGVFNPQEIHAFSKFHYQYMRYIGWGIKDSLKVLYSETNVVIWIIFIFYGVWWVINSFRKERKNLWILIPLAIFFYPFIAGVTAGHYIMAIVCFAPFFLTKIIKDLSDFRFFRKRNWRINKFGFGVAFFSIFLQIFSIEATSQFPYLTIKRRPSYIYTHDGKRFLGGYFYGYYNILMLNRNPSRETLWGNAHFIADKISLCKHNDLVFISDGKKDNYFYPLTAYMLPVFLQLKGYVLEVGEDNSFVLKKKGHRVFFLEHKAAWQKDTAIVLYVPVVKLKDNNISFAVRRFNKEIEKICR